MTGLVLDSGHLESTVLPVRFHFPRSYLLVLSFPTQIYASRPLFPLLRTTPLAGARLTQHIRELLLAFGTYCPPPPLLGAAVPPVPTRAPAEILTPTLLEEIKARCCFVSYLIPTGSDREDDSMAIDVPTSSDSEMSASDAETESEVASVGQGASSTNPAFAEAERARTTYSQHSDATDLVLRVVPPGTPSLAPGTTTRGTLTIPGWIRERAAEVLFEGGDVDEKSVSEVILDTLLKVRFFVILCCEVRSI